MQANALVGVAMADFFPRIILSGFAGGVTPELAGISTVWSLAAGLTGPIFQGGQIRANYQASIAVWEQAKLQYEQAVLTAFQEVASALTALRLPGVRFRPARFTPTFHKWAGRLCGGVQVHVTDEARFKPVLTYLGVIAVARRLAPGSFRWKQPPYEFERRRLPIDILLGTDIIRRSLERGKSLRDIERAWLPDLSRWRRRRTPALLYR